MLQIVGDFVSFVRQQQTTIMNAINFAPTHKAAQAIGMTIDEAVENPKVASLRAGKKLRELGYVRRYHHLAWDKGMRWFSPSGEIFNETNTTMLGWALAK
jgi:hypothetical protein